ncbi:isopentenyl-diphosphate Delta-isomerase [Mucilaginibacter gilvus]|uniref:Isopentenyl-diphosphate delta-isomerase n=1 Tax=Mucilaginibacter gilvus TaxID=2305909 RepID=A0A3S3UTF6_9SPHI|nr:isopentenyl-diphosphate Delta-isomerase [Mucilaginibacter gilvus]RWY54016.1 isopentenyl-diphosphate Delta-isomerase [Mucilaginibacter gilvus]
MSEIIIAVNEQGRITGTLDKLRAHITGQLHRAFSIFIFNTDGQLLLQQRADAKYHSGGKWTNTCCSHPRIGEQTSNAAHRRLQEEMGFDCELKEIFSFRYCETLQNGLIENEFDHVFFGISNQQPIPDPSEVKDFEYLNMELISYKLKTDPGSYTVWLNICFEQVMEHFKTEIKYEASDN